ncbi:MAG: signal peptidase I [Eubacteriales bacterium]|nr:signal peptidase I [Eubacteriales bacterium]
MDKNSRGYHILKELLQWAEAILLAILIAIIIRALLIENVRVLGSSMEDTLYTDERLIVYKLGYKLNKPKRGDIIVLKTDTTNETEQSFFSKINLLNSAFPPANEVDYIKRVIGEPGDIVDIIDGAVYINGKKLYEPYAKGFTYSNGGVYPKEVPEGCVFVLGDNRRVSRDSREIGFVPIKNIRGKAFFRIWPFSKFGAVK